MREYFPKHSDNLMKNEGNTKKAREAFLSTKNLILYNLVKDRYSWMNTYINAKDRKIMELGCGMGVSKLFIKNKYLKLTDITANEWVDEVVDALNINCPDHSLDVVICSHMIHHLANPRIFFEQIQKKLKPGGRIIIRDIYTGSMMKIVLRIMRHEGFSDKVNVFDRNAICNSPDDPWSANCSIPKLLFFKGDFEKEFPCFRILKKEYNECLMFFLSGGVIAKTFYLPVNKRGVRVIRKIDRFVVKLCPGFFAAGCSIVLKKINS